MNNEEGFSWKLGGRSFLLLVGICVLQIAAVIYDFDFFDSNGYLPTPFAFDKNDTFMDFFHPSFWSTRDGRYSEWHSVYPPLNFIFLELICWLQTHGQDLPNAFALREMAPGMQTFIVLVYLVAPAFVVTRTYWNKFSALERLFFYVAAISSAPILFALERGNLIIFSFFFLPFLFSRSSMIRFIALALLVNLKPYFAPLLLVYAFKGDWDGLILACVFTCGIYLFTCVLLASDPLAVPFNLLGFSQDDAVFSPREVLAMPSSVSSFSYLLNSDEFHKSRWFDLLPLDIDLMSLVVETTKWGIEGLALATLWKVRNVTPFDQMFAVILVMISNSSISVGGYTLIFYFALLPVFYGMRLERVYMSLVALVALPLDWLVLMQQNFPQQFSYLSGQIVDVQWALGAGSIIRPTLNLTLLAALAWELATRPQPAISDTRSHLNFDSSERVSCKIVHQ